MFSTTENNLPSIRKHGLGGKTSKRNYEISRSGIVYLTDNPDAAETYVVNSQFHRGNDGIVILVVDVSHLDVSRLMPDDNDEGDFGNDSEYQSFEYHGIIPPSALREL